MKPNKIQFFEGEMMVESLEEYSKTRGYRTSSAGNRVVSTLTELEYLAITSDGNFITEDRVLNFLEIAKQIAIERCNKDCRKFAVDILKQYVKYQIAVKEQRLMHSLRLIEILIIQENR